MCIICTGLGMIYRFLLKVLDIRNPFLFIHKFQFWNNHFYLQTLLTQTITSGMCGIMDDLPMTIQKGTASVNGKNLASLVNMFSRIETNSTNIV